MKKIFIIILMWTGLASAQNPELYVMSLPEEKKIEELLNINTDTIKNSKDTAESECAKSFRRGQQDAASKSGIPWAIGGFASSCLFAGCGSTLFPIIPVHLPVVPREFPDGVDRDCYKYGYQNRVTRKRVVSSAIGGAFGLVTLIAIFMAAGAVNF